MLRSRSSRSAPSRAAWSGRPRRRRAVRRRCRGCRSRSRPISGASAACPTHRPPAGHSLVRRPGRGPAGWAGPGRWPAELPAVVHADQLPRACVAQTEHGVVARRPARREVRRGREAGVDLVVDGRRGRPVALDGQALGPVHGPAGAGVTGGIDGSDDHTMRPRGCALAGRGRRHGPQQPSGHNGDGGNDACGTLHRRSPLDRCRRWDAVMPVMVASRSARHRVGDGACRGRRRSSPRHRRAPRRRTAARTTPPAGSRSGTGSPNHPGAREHLAREARGDPTTARRTADEELAHQP